MHWFRYGIVLLSFLVLTSCTSTGVVANWTDIDPHPPVDNVLIAGMTDDQQNRAMFEEALSEELEQKGMTAIKSTTVLPQNRQPDMETVLAEARNRGIDFVMVTRIMEIGDKDVLVPEYNPILYGYESGGNPYGLLHKFQKERKLTQRFVKLRTDLIDTGTEKRIWSAISETTKADAHLSAKEVIDSVCATVGEELQPSRARG